MGTSVQLVGLASIGVFIATSPAIAATEQLRLVASDLSSLNGTATPDNTTLWSGTAAIPWIDASGHGRDGTAPYSYDAPKYQRGEAGLFNGCDYVTMGGDNDRVRGSASLTDWGFTTMVVGNFSPTTGSRCIMALGDTTSSYHYFSLTISSAGNLTVVMRDSSYPTITASTVGPNFAGADHLFTVDYRAQNDVEVYVDGQSVLTYTGAGTGITFNLINAYGIGVQPLSTAGAGAAGSISVAEARYYTGAWAAGELETVTEQLTNLYGLAVPEPASLSLLTLGCGVILQRRRRGRN